MRIEDFNYHLPSERIAQDPPQERGKANLLVLDRAYGALAHRTYADLVDYLEPGDLLVLNNTKVIKARLLTLNQSGHQRELLLLERHHDLNPHLAPAIHRGKVRKGDVLTVGSTQLAIKELRDDGTVIVGSDANIYELAASQGHVPLPPYMKRSDTNKDVERYQTVFAQKAGSVAAPTASLNLTESLLENIRSKGVTIAYLTLHVGYGTFMPIKTDNLTDHEMHSEYFEIPAETVQHIRKTKASGGKITAVGTTVTRTLEYAAEELASTPGAISGEANIFIYPGYEFQVVDQLLTNFHAPKSTVLMMAAAFAGWHHLERAYLEALENDYRFLSYGDSMLITESLR